MSSTKRAVIPNGKQIAEIRKSRIGWTQLDLAESSGLSKRAIQLIEKGRPCSPTSIRRIADALETEVKEITLPSSTPAPLPCLTDPDPVATERKELTDATQHQLRHLETVAQRIVTYGMNQATRAYFFPHMVAEVETDPQKNTTLSLEDDPTLPMDQAALDALLEGLQVASLDATCPLSEGFRFYNEETGPRDFPGLASKYNPRRAKWIIFGDPVDFTDAAILGLDGSVLLSIYHIEWGYCVAVAGDLFRRKLYWRRRGSHPLVATLDPFDAMGTPTLTAPSVSRHSTTMTTSGQSDTKNASFNIYMGKPQRIMDAVQMGGKLLSEGGIKATFSVGGSLGPIRVAEGLFDASVEYMKGFRPWDYACGCFIAKGAGAAVVDLGGEDLPFGPSEDLHEAVMADFKGEYLDKCRQKFVVAATEELARRIVQLLIS